MLNRLWGSLLLAGVLVVVAKPASAALIDLIATIDGAQANMGLGTGSAATGFANMTLDTDSNLFNWEITWSGLEGNITVAHFHGPAAPGFNAGVEVPITDLTSPSIGSATLSEAQETDLLAGLWYINIHSDLNAVTLGGEIRGQVETVPEPAAFILLAMSLFGLRRRL